MELRNRKYIINHKTVQRLMKELGLKCMVRIKKYKSCRGDIGKIAPNLLERNFKADKPNQKWVTDVTKFSLLGKKLYLSPILDLFNGEIISYNLSERPTFHQTTEMLEKAFEKIPDGTNLILHSDQGWQYQMRRYQYLLKTELLYLQEFDTIEQFVEELETYIDYYNNKRIKSKLKGLSPIQYRLQSMKVA